MDADFYKNNKYKISRQRRDVVLSLVRASSKTVLDIGCSDGTLGAYIKEGGAKVHGIDISTDALAIAGERLDAVYQFDVTTQEWPADIAQTTYDTIILSEVLEHMFYPEHVLEKIKHISYADTEIIVTVPNILFWKNRLKIFFGSFEYTNKGLMDRGHIHFFSWKSLTSLVEKAGYHIERRAHVCPTRGTKWLGKIWPGLFAYQFVITIKHE